MTAPRATFQEQFPHEDLEPVFEPQARLSLRRLTIVAALVLLALVIVFERDALGASAHAACTIGTPSGTSCGEALVRVGYP
jgi:hypothetical protein